MRLITAAAALAAGAYAQATYDYATFDCKMRAAAMEFAYDIAPQWTAADYQRVADALNGSPHFENLVGHPYQCNVSTLALPGTSAAVASSGPRFTFPLPLPESGVATLYVDANKGSDTTGTGTYDAPFQTVHKAVAASRAASGGGGGATIVLRGGTYYFGAAGLGAIALGAADSGLTFQAYPGEQPIISGAVPLPAGLNWQPYKTTGGANIWQASLAGTGISGVPGLRLNGTRLIRARYPNADPEIGFGSTLFPQAWIPPDPLPTPTMLNPTYPVRNFTSMGTLWEVGIGGGCALYSPPIGYLCNNQTQRFGNGLDLMPRWPKGMYAGQNLLPNTPYSSAIVGSAVVHAWRDSHWFTRQHLVSGYNASNATFLFGLGGFQGGEGTDADNEFYVENIFEELDAPGEWFYNTSSQVLYYWHNASSGTLPPNGGPSDGGVTLAVTQAQVLFNATGSQDAPVAGISFLGLEFRDTAITYFEPHGLPSSGDWAMQRTAALYFDGTQGLTVDGCTFERLDGISIMLSGYSRNAVIQNTEFAWLGETAIALWGRSAQGPHPDVGWDTTPGNQPRYTTIRGNIFRELGVWQKQSSAVFQAEAGLSQIEGNIVYNGPRAGINFNDGSIGGSNITRNLQFNLCRESGDHGPFNSWDRTAYLNDLRGYNSTMKLWDTISYNFWIANYNSMSAVDNDDGSFFYAIHHNAFFYSPFGLKSDFGGAAKDYHDNAIFIENTQGQWYWCGPDAVWITYTQQQEGFQDAFYNNVVIQLADGDFSIGQVCNSTQAPGWLQQSGYITAGGDIIPPGQYTVAAAEALCNATAGCLAITFNAPNATPNGAVNIYFKNHVDIGADPTWWTYVLEGRPPAGVTVVRNNTYFTPHANITECGYPLAAWQALNPVWNDPGSTVGGLPDADTFLAAARAVVGMPPQ